MGPLGPLCPSGKGQRLAWTPRYIHHSAQLLLLHGQVPVIFQLHPMAYSSYNIARCCRWPDIALSPPGEILGLRSYAVHTYVDPSSSIPGGGGISDGKGSSILSRDHSPYCLELFLREYIPLSLPRAASWDCPGGLNSPLTQGLSPAFTPRQGGREGCPRMPGIWADQSPWFAAPDHPNLW